MERSHNQPYQQEYFHCFKNQECLPWQTVPVLLWQEPTGSSQWFWFILASSPIVALIVLLVIGILILLLIVWLRSRRRPKIDTSPLSSSARPLEAVHSAETLVGESASSAVEAPTYDEDLAKTQPSPLAKVPKKEVAVPVRPVQTMPVSGERPPNIGWRIAGLTDVGLKRDLNEDSLLMVEAVMPDHTPYGLYVVADGLGGHQGGEVASQLTIDAILSHFTQQPPASAAGPCDDWLKAAAMAANLAVLGHQTDLDQAKKMGSTVVMALVMAGQAHIANVGDSRAYHLSHNSIQQVSVDHSLVERLVQIGQLTRDEARTHKNRNVLYNSIGDKPEMEVSTYHIDLQPGDWLLLCSDGLSGMITDEEILDISRAYANPAVACTELVRAAKAAGGTDNITVIIVQMDSQ